MAPKSQRSRRRRSSRQGAANAEVPAPSGTKQRRRASRNTRSADNSTKLIVAAVAVALVALVGLGVYQVSTGAGAAANFDIRVYQGEERLGGSKVRFADLLDEPVPVVLNFWGGSCPPCRAEMPALQRIYEAHKDELLLVGLDVGEYMGLGSERSALALLAELDITYPAGTPPTPAPLNNYAIDGLPATVFFGRDGKIFRIWTGAIREDQMEAIVSEMLAAS